MASGAGVATGGDLSQGTTKLHCQENFLHPKSVAMLSLCMTHLHLICMSIVGVNLKRCTRCLS